MQTRLDPRYHTPAGRRAEAILRACVHCGFCTATCPTYLLTGDELDGPRGRVYLLKQLFEGDPVGRTTQRHLDRCLVCRACESTCPSGVAYAELLDLGRVEVERQVTRSAGERLQRWLLRRVLPHPRRVAGLVRLGRWVRPLLPCGLARRIPPAQRPLDAPSNAHDRHMLVLDGCVQQAATPATNAALARILDRLGIRVVHSAGQGCCGALSHHLGAVEEARRFMRRNIDAWWPAVEAGAEAVLVSASGCAVMVAEYDRWLADDPEYADKARRIAALVRDPVEVLEQAPLERLGLQPPEGPVAFHAPCTLQHGECLAGRVETLLERLGFRLLPVADAHRCCGSGGTWSLRHPELARRLRDEKLRALQAGAPVLIATANVGCQLHLGAAAEVPVRHWLELLTPE